MSFVAVLGVLAFCDLSPSSAHGKGGPAPNGAAQKKGGTTPKIDLAGTVSISPFALPLSSYMSERAKQAFIKRRASAGTGDVELSKLTPQQQRELFDSWFRPLVEHAKKVHAVELKEKWISGVRTDVVLPKSGVASQNVNRVLINLHGGSYSYGTGGGLAGLLEAIPISDAAKIEVIAIDYKTSPGHRFPSALMDVVAVYRELLKTHSAESIGIYGCSTGATLTANVTAWLQKEGLPRPGAIGLFCGGATKDDQIEGDSYYTAAASMGDRVPAPGEPYPAQPYMEGTSSTDPIVAPAVSLEVLSAFPPTLLITGTRDLVLSAAVYTHARLVKSGVEADLHVWDGMWHAFFYDVDLPESKEAYDVVAKFFDKHLREAS